MKQQSPEITTTAALVTRAVRPDFSVESGLFSGIGWSMDNLNRDIGHLRLQGDCAFRLTASEPSRRCKSGDSCLRVTIPVELKHVERRVFVGDFIEVWERLWPGVISADFGLEPLKANVLEGNAPLLARL